MNQSLFPNVSLIITPNMCFTLSHVLLLCKYKTHIQSIAIGWDFAQLLRHKCWTQIYELMKFGVNYQRFARYDAMNLLSHVCHEAPTEDIHIDIARLYLAHDEDSFCFETFCLPFYYAVRTSSITMISLLMSYGANIETLFETDDWCNVLQCIIQSPQPCMNKIEFVLKALRQKYGRDKDKISWFLNYKNG
eukprot:340725_1